MRGRFFFTKSEVSSRYNERRLVDSVVKSVDLATVTATEDDMLNDVVTLYVGQWKFEVAAAEDVAAIRAILDDEIAHNNAALLIGQEKI